MFPNEKMNETQLNHQTNKSNCIFVIYMKLHEERKGRKVERKNDAAGLEEEKRKTITAS